MQIHELKVKPKKNRKRIGRGGKRGTYSGKGMKGQKARSGGNVDPLFEGGRTTIIDKLKKVRGFKAINAKKNVVSLDVIENKFKDGDVISIKSLLEAGVIRRSKKANGVKILGDGTLKKKVSIDKGIQVSKSAKEAIEKAGGTIGGAKQSKAEPKKAEKKEEKASAKKILNKPAVKKVAKKK